MPRPRIILLAVGRNFHVNATLSTYFRYLSLLIASSGLSQVVFLPRRARRISCNKYTGNAFICSNALQRIDEISSHVSSSVNLFQRECFSRLCRH